MVSAFYFIGSKQKFGRGVGYPRQRDRRLPLEPGQRLHRGRPAGRAVEAARSTTPSRRTSSCRAKAAYYDTGFGLFAARRARQDLHARLRRRARPSAPTRLPRRPAAEGPQHRRQLLLPGHGRQQRAEVRLRLPRVTKTTEHVALQRQPARRDHQRRRPTRSPRSGATASPTYGGKYFSAYLGDVLTKNRFTINLGRPLGPADGEEPPERGSRPTSAFPNVVPGARVRRATPSNLIELERPVAAARHELRARRVAQDRAARVVRLLRRPALLRTWRPTRTRRSTGYLAYGWNDSTATASCSRAKSTSTTSCTTSTSTPPTRARSDRTVNKVDRDLKPQRDHEFVLGIDRELGAELGGGRRLHLAPAAATGPTARASAAPARASRPRTPAGSSSRTSTPANAPATANGYTGLHLLAERGPRRPRAAAGASGPTPPATTRPSTASSSPSPSASPTGGWAACGLLLERLDRDWDGTPYCSAHDDGNPAHAPRRSARAGRPGRPSCRAARARPASTSIVPSGSSTPTPSTSCPGASTSRPRSSARQGGVYPVSLRLSGGARRHELRALATRPIDDQHLRRRLELRPAPGQDDQVRQGAGLTLSAECSTCSTAAGALACALRQLDRLHQHHRRAPTPAVGRIEEIISAAHLPFRSALQLLASGAVTDPTAPGAIPGAVFFWGVLRRPQTPAASGEPARMARQMRDGLTVALAEARPLG